MVIEAGGVAADTLPRAKLSGESSPTGASPAPGSAAESLALLAGGKKAAGKGKGGFPAALEAATRGAKAGLSKALKIPGAKPGEGHATDPAAALASAMKNRAAKAAAELAAGLGARGPAPVAVSAQGHGTKAEAAPGKKKEAAARTGAQDAQVLVALLAEAGRQPKAAGETPAEHGTDRTQAGQATPVEGHGPVIRIVDLRTPDKHAVRSDASAVQQGPAQAVGADRDISALIVGKPASARDLPPAGERPPAAPAAQTPLDRLRDAAGPELLRAANLVLRDGGGEIRLVLKPESLGSVRIQMNLVDNRIDGRIIVDSSTVKHIFDANVDALRRALTAEGFNTGSLQVSVGGQGTGQDARRDEQPVRLARATAAVEGFQGSVPAADDISLGDLLVNLFV